MSFFRHHPEEEPTPETTEPPVEVTPETPEEVTTEVATEPTTPNTLPVLQAHDPGDGGKLETCVICNRPIEVGQNYLRAAYGSVHQEVCSAQTKRV